MKILQIWVKLGSKLAKNGPFFSQFLAAAFLARNVSQNHFSFSREMREMCISNWYLRKWNYELFSRNIFSSESKIVIFPHCEVLHYILFVEKVTKNVGKPLRKWYCTVWKFQIFYATQILREIELHYFSSSKNCHIDDFLHQLQNSVAKHSCRPPSLNLILTNSRANFAKNHCESKVKSAMYKTYLEKLWL